MLHRTCVSQIASVVKPFISCQIANSDEIQNKYLKYFYTSIKPNGLNTVSQYKNGAILAIELILLSCILTFVDDSFPKFLAGTHK